MTPEGAQLLTVLESVRDLLAAQLDEMKTSREESKALRDEALRHARRARALLDKQAACPDCGRPLDDRLPDAPPEPEAGT